MASCNVLSKGSEKLLVENYGSLSLSPLLLRPELRNLPCFVSSTNWFIWSSSYLTSPAAENIS
jgi:hypothetical protein